MRYFKYMDGGYITHIGTGTSGTEISEAEYAEILSILRNTPKGTANVGYRLKEDLSWESYELEPGTDTTIDDQEILDIIFGGADL
jgi:hypothetical protein